jgi:hypothetical protein
MSKENDNIYIDLLLSNSLQTSSNNKVQASFFQTQSEPILKDTTDYKLSIVRFTLNTETLPIFIPTMQTDTQTIYSITLGYNDFYYQQYMTFQPQNSNTSDPDEKYYIYSYQYLIYLVNNCLNSCLVNLSNLVQLSTTQAPYFTFNNDNQKCNLSFDSNFYGYNETNKINIYMNYAMYSIFTSLPASQVNLNTQGKDYQINNTFVLNKSVLEQEYSTIDLWNPVSSIIFTSNLLPIYKSTTPPVQIYIEGKLTNNSTNSNFLNTVTDFIADNMQFVPFVQYSPGIYRFISLKPSTEIRNIDIQIFWKNKKDGILKPLYLNVGGSASVKIYITKNYQ